MKKLLSILLCLALIIPLSSCKKESDNTEITYASSTTAATTEATIPEDAFTFEKGEDGGYIVTSFTAGEEAPHEVSIPATHNGLAVTTIGKDVARGSSAISVLIIADSITVIEDGAFADCSSLIKVDMPEGIERIGGGAFNNCDLLETVELPWNVELGQDAFGDCEALDKKIYVPRENEVMNILMVGNSFCYYYPDELLLLLSRRAFRSCQGGWNKA